MKSAHLHNTQFADLNGPLKICRLASNETRDEAYLSSNYFKPWNDKDQ